MTTYTTTYQIEGLNQDETLLLLMGASDRHLVVHRAEATFQGANQQLTCSLEEVETLGSPTGTLVPPFAPGSSEEAGATVLADITAGEPEYLENSELGKASFPSAAGWLLQPPTADRPRYNRGANVGIRLLTAPASTNCIVTITWHEEF